MRIDQLGIRTQNLIIEDENGCWLWQGFITDDGYALSNGKHRSVYEELVGPIPEGLQLDHLCRVRHCINPEHLEPVTPRENVHRSGVMKGTPTHCPSGHLRSDHIYIVPKTGQTQCRECSRLRMKEIRRVRSQA